MAPRSDGLHVSLMSNNLFFQWRSVMRAKKMSFRKSISSPVYLFNRSP